MGKKESKIEVKAAPVEKAAKVLRNDVDIFDKRLLLPVTLIAHAFDVTMDAVLKWGLKPVEKKHRESLLYLPEVIANRMGFGPDGAPKLNPAQEKALLDQTKRRSAELDLDYKRGELVKLSEVGKEIDRQVIVTRQRLISLPSRVARTLASIDDPAEIQEILTKELEKATDELSSDPRNFRNSATDSGSVETSQAAAETDVS